MSEMVKRIQENREKLEKPKMGLGVSPVDNPFVMPVVSSPRQSIPSQEIPTQTIRPQTVLERGVQEAATAERGPVATPLRPEEQIRTTVQSPTAEMDPRGVEQDEEEIVQTYRLRRPALSRPSASVGSREREIRAAFDIKYQPNTRERERLLTELERASAGLPPEKRDFYEAQLAKVRTQSADLLDEIKRAKDTAVDEKDKQDRFLLLGQAMETIGHNLTRLFAANYGLKKGVDMSGLRFDKFDWEKTQSRYDRRFDQTLAELEQRYKSTVESQAKSEASVMEAMSKEEEGLQKQASTLSKELTDFEKFESGKQFEAEKATAQGRLEERRLAGQEAYQKESLALQRERLAEEQRRTDMNFQLQQMRLEEIAARKQQAAKAKAEGQMDKAAALDMKNKQEAVSAVLNQLTKFPDKQLTEEQYSEVVDKTAGPLKEAGFDLYTELPNLQDDKGALFWKSKVVNKQKLVDYLKSQINAGQPAESSATIAPSPLQNAGALFAPAPETIPDAEPPAE